MLSTEDFSKKQILFVFFNAGEKLSFSNDNLVVRDKDNKIKFQCTCYRLFLVMAVGNGSITSGLIQRAKKFGFSIVFLTQGMKPYQSIGNALDGNTLLHRAQYEYKGLDIAKHITANKMRNQRQQLMRIRSKNDLQKEAIAHITEYLEALPAAENLHALMGYEGSASRVYFAAFFSNVAWKRRAPRTKCDMVNCVLDIGYSLLFSFIDALLNCYGFDTYCGVMHTEFYMRKSLVCDIVEPFRCLIDAQVKKAVNLKQCKEEDFYIDNGRYTLRWEKNADYIAWLSKPVMEHKSQIHAYIQSYYRAFMKHKPIEAYPVFLLEDEP